MARKKKDTAGKDKEQEAKLKPIDVTREEIEGYRGGASLNLSSVDKITKLPLRDRLSKHIGDILDTELINHAKVKENLAKWQRQYQGKKPKKGFPFEGAANVAVPISR